MVQGRFCPPIIKSNKKKKERGWSDPYLPSSFALFHQYKEGHDNLFDLKYELI
jgi:hypothetical protein